MPETHKGDVLATSTFDPESTTNHEGNAAATCETQLPHLDTHRRHRLHESLLSVFGQRNMLLAFTVLFVGALRPATLSVLLQYVTVRFGWPISQTAMLVSEIAIVNIVLFLFILPQLIVWISSRWQIQPQIIDWTIVLVSLLILALGAALIGVAPSTSSLISGKHCEDRPAHLDNGLRV